MKDIKAINRVHYENNTQNVHNIFLELFLKIFKF